jgi:hypothetical protein
MDPIKLDNNIKLRCCAYNDGDNTNYIYIYNKDSIKRIKQLNYKDIKRALLGDYTEDDVNYCNNNILPVKVDYSIDYGYLEVINRYGIDYINLYNIDEVKLNEVRGEAEEGDITEWLTLLTNIYGDDYKDWDDYLAYQFNNIKNYQLGECLTGYKSTGKTLYFNIKEAIFGKSNCSTIQGIASNFKFNGGFANKRQTLIDEFDLTDDYVIKAIKAQITSDFIYWEKKGQEPIKIPYYSNIGITSERIPSKLASEMQGKRMVFRDCKIVLDDGFKDRILKTIPAIKYYYQNHPSRNKQPNILNLIRKYSQYQDLASGDIKEQSITVFNEFIGDVKLSMVEGAKVIKETAETEYIKIDNKHLDELHQRLVNLTNTPFNTLKEGSPFRDYNTLRDLFTFMRGVNYNKIQYNNRHVLSINKEVFYAK